MQTNHDGLTLMFCQAIDSFLSIRRLETAELALSMSPSTSREEYIQLVVRACVPEFETEVAPHGDALIAAGDPLGAVHLEEDVFDLCRQVNPHLDLTRISLPQPVEQGDSDTPSLDRETVRDLPDLLRRQVLGQGEAIDIVCRALRRGASGLHAGDRPLASFLFAGTTGVGKTEMAKSLAEGLFGDRSRLLRLDGSEYALPHEAAKLIGAPPGYVGHDQGGQLTEQARKMGSGVLLVDEIEKADSMMHNMLLQLLDEGRLTDSRGETVDFTRFVVILTTNTGAFDMEARRRAPGFGRDGRELDTSLRVSTTEEALADRFAPEFLNRIDHRIVFNEIDRDTCRQIVDHQVDDLESRCHGLGFKLTVSETARERLVDGAWDPRWGAREIRRHIVTRLETPLADWLIDEDLKGHRLTADVTEDTISLTRRDQAA